MKKHLDITDTNGISKDTDTTCAFTDMNCVEEETKPTLVDMNRAAEKDETCAFTDMNCLDNPTKNN